MKPFEIFYKMGQNKPTPDREAVQAELTDEERQALLEDAHMWIQEFVRTYHCLPTLEDVYMSAFINGVSMAGFSFGKFEAKP